MTISPFILSLKISWGSVSYGSDPGPFRDGKARGKTEPFELNPHSTPGTVCRRANYLTLEEALFQGPSRAKACRIISLIFQADFNIIGPKLVVLPSLIFSKTLAFPGPWREMMMACKTAPKRQGIHCFSDRRICNPLHSHPFSVTEAF